jgi:hypothetical protein
MIRAGLSIAAIVLVTATSSAQAQTTTGRPAGASTAAARESCADLHKRYDMTHRAIAAIDAEDIGDNSAPRATLRQLKILSEKQDQLILLEFMRSRGCPAPSAVGASVLYMLPAMECATAKLTGKELEAKCDQSKWVPLSTSSETTSK